MLAQFRNLFKGSSLAHGTWNKDTGAMATVPYSASEEDYRNHLIGELGLGLIPVNEEGLCYFGAIDIDIDTIDHKDLYDRVAKRNLPLNVCRSKSGGAHLYIFFKEPHAASDTQAILKKYAGLLGFPSKTEIFPKQTKSTKDNFGNWINLPYFKVDNTLRYAIGEDGSLEFEEFIASIKYYTGKERVDASISSDLIQIDQMPPCLRVLTQEGLPTGTRNVGLFSYGVFYRKSSPNGWQDKLRNHNKNYVSPPLGSREVEALIKSLDSRQYQYKCDEEPLCSRCDRKTCLSLPFGIGNKPWEDENNYDEIALCNLRKIKTDPPTYILEINSKDVQLTSDEFRSHEKLRKRIFELQDSIIRPIKQSQWEQKVRSLLSNKTDIEAPDDASSDGMIISKVDDFLALSDRAKSKDDLLRGLPIIDNDRVLFQVDFLQKYLTSQKVSIQNQQLYSILRRRDCDYAVIKIKGKTIRAWSMPLISINRQTENYTPAEFEQEESEI